MGNLLFWLGIGAAQNGADSKPFERRIGLLGWSFPDRPVVGVGDFILLVQPTMKRR